MAENGIKKTGMEKLTALFDTGRADIAARDVRVGLAGGGPLLVPVAKAYSSLGLKHPLVLFSPRSGKPGETPHQIPGIETAGSFSEFADRVDAVEVFDIPDGRKEIVLRLLEAGRHVSLNKPFARSIEEAEDIARAARRPDAILRVNEYALFYEPYKKLKSLIDAMEIGEVCAVRFQCNLAGADGAPWRELLNEWDCFFHPAFDRFALAMHLLGDVESVICYANRMAADRGGQALVGFKYKSPGRYGVLDLTYAPGTSIRTDGIPCDDRIEVAGTDGVIWANHFHGKMTEEPWIEVRRGKKHYTMGISSDMAVEWKDCIASSANHFLNCAAGRTRPVLSARAAIKALRFQLAAAEASENNREIKV
ncbi:MAG TPA: Gfo/Idh/MocA family oxidoreductase [bacterium]|nr:Gfo/Idh/MocA family oxidoreductase [bacterium]